MTFIKKRLKSLWWPFVKWEVIFLLLHNFLYKCNICDQAYSFEEVIKRFFQYLYMFGSEQLLGGFWFLHQLLLASLLGWTTVKIVEQIKRHFLCIDYKC